MKIAVTTNEVRLTVTLNDTATARDLVALLPLEVTVEDFHGIEKIAHLPRALSLEGAPAGSAARAGDLTLYAPWGNLAFFYRDFDYAAGLVPLGKVDGDAAALESLADGAAASITVVNA